MENDLDSTGDSRLDQAITQWLQYDKVRPNTFVADQTQLLCSFKCVRSDIFSAETEVQYCQNPF